MGCGDKALNISGFEGKWRTGRNRGNSRLFEEISGKGEQRKRVMVVENMDGDSPFF